MRRGNQETLWKGSNIKMPFFWCMIRSGPVRWIPPLSLHSKGDYWALWCSLWNINRAGRCCRGLWRTALLFACKWAASNSMTTEAINNGGIGWNPCCKHAQLEHKCKEARLGWKQSSVRGDASSVGSGENGDFESSLGAQSWLSAGCLSSSYRFWALQTLPIGAVTSIRRPVVAITLWSSPRAR